MPAGLRQSLSPAHTPCLSLSPGSAGVRDKNRRARQHLDLCNMYVMVMLGKDRDARISITYYINLTSIHRGESRKKVVQYKIENNKKD